MPVTVDVPAVTVPVGEGVSEEAAAVEPLPTLPDAESVILVACIKASEPREQVIVYVLLTTSTEQPLIFVPGSSLICISPWAVFTQRISSLDFSLIVPVIVALVVESSAIDCDGATEVILTACR